MKEFEIINEITHSVPHSDISHTIRKVKCPDCGYIFTQTGKGGFLPARLSPMDCSKCNHPLHHLKNLSSEESIIK